MRFVHRVLSSQMFATGVGTEFIWSASRALHRTGLHRLRNLFLLLPGTGGNHGLPNKSESFSRSARSRACASSVKETWPW